MSNVEWTGQSGFDFVMTRIWMVECFTSGACLHNITSPFIAYLLKIIKL